MYGNSCEEQNPNNFWLFPYNQQIQNSGQLSQHYDFQQKLILSQQENWLEIQSIGNTNGKQFKIQQNDCLFKNLNYMIKTQVDQIKNESEKLVVDSSISQIKHSKNELQKMSRTSKQSNHKMSKKSSKFVLKQACVKKITKKFAISKFLVRLFLKFHEQYQVSPLTQSYNSRIKMQLQKFNENKFNLERDAMKFLNPNLDQKDQMIGQQNRRVMLNILQDKIRSEVIMNSATERNRISYLIGSKIYALRCRSSTLCRKANFR